MPIFHPNEQQRKFAEVAEWALNTNIARGSGRSTAMAFGAIRMAMQGARVHLLDPSLVFNHGANYSVHRHFANRVVDVARTYFPEYEFELSALDNTLRYVGRRAPIVNFTPIPVDPEPESTTQQKVKDFDDDGSEENT